MNSNMIEDDALIDYAQSLIPLQENTGATFFELTTAIAFRYFADMKVDVAVIEAGMGGMNDATNIMSSIISIITPISLEHTQYLGDTIEKIANDKSKIIKPHSKALISDKNRKLQNVFFNQSHNVSAELYYTSDLVSLKNFEIQADFSSKFNIIDTNHQTKTYFTPLIGNFQIENAMMAIAGAKLLENDFLINEIAVQRGLQNVIKNTHLSSRFEKLSENPLIFLDSGHNPGAINEIADSIILMRNSLDGKFHILEDGFSFLMALMDDKDADGVFAVISPFISHLILTQPNTHRATDPNKLKQIASKYIPGPSIEVIPTVSEAYKKLIELNQPSIILGSFYLAEEVKRAIQIFNLKPLE